MKSKLLVGSLLCAAFSAATLNAQTVVEPFEFASPDDATAAWTGSGGAVVTSSTDKASTAPGSSSLELAFEFPSTTWATAIARGPVSDTPVAIDPAKYISFRVKGDPAFQQADFRDLYLYVYDTEGRFGRWGGPVPVTDSWTVVNYLASTIQKPWDSPDLPDLSQIVQLAFFQYGSEAAIPPYSATIRVDDLQLRDAPLVEVPTTLEYMVQDFEYASSEDIAAEWAPSGNAVVSLAADKAFRAGGTNSMKIDFDFQSSAWATATIQGPALDQPIAIGPDQFITMRVKGDPNFAAADFRDLYLYAYDADGNFGRWGAPTPTNSDWTIWNFRAGTINKPWDSPALPDLSRISKLSLFQYGSETAIPAYTASVHVDEIMVRNAPLTEFPAPSAPRNLIENFESYANAEALLAAYGYVNSPAATMTTADIETPAGQASKALKMQIDFSGGQYPWGSIRSLPVAPFSFPTNGVLSVRFKGDPALAPVADAATSFWISFYDSAGRPTHMILPTSVVTNADWSTITAPFADLTDTAGVDVGNLVQWRILVQGWEGTADSTPLSATFYVDDIQITTESAAPQLGIRREGTGVVITWPESISGYALEGTPNLANPTWQAVPATGNSATVTPATGIRFFRLKSN